MLATSKFSYQQMVFYSAGQNYFLNSFDTYCFAAIGMIINAVLTAAVFRMQLCASFGRSVSPR
jgi:hypothetical protein